MPTAVVDPTVREVRLTAPRGARVVPGMLASARTKSSPGGGSRLVSAPQKVTGYGAVGVTWEHGDVVPDDEISIKVRTRDESGWSDWLAMSYHDDHGPDPDSEEGRRARPGTDELLVGEVDQVQVKVVTAEPTPADLSLAVIDPGVATTSERELPAIDTGAGDAEPAVATALPTSDGDVELAAASYTPKPQIYSRAQWGADERMRDPGSLHYYEVHAGFVHHTVNANNYRREGRARDPARHLRLPHAVPRLERRRLQLPGRPVRPDLGGPLRRRSTARWSAPTRSATTTTRSRPRRSATSRRCSRRRR